MFHFLPAPIAALLALVIIGTHTILVAAAIILMLPLKLITRLFRKDTKLVAFFRAPYHFWFKAFPFYFRLFGSVKINLKLPDSKIDLDNSGLIIANHQSWFDILILTGALGKRIPSPTFFLKQELIWVPFIGPPCWIMDHIFVRRTTKKQLEKNPELKGKDIENARQKCRKLKNYPTTVINFVEGTRITKAKYEKSPKQLRYLLPAKAGGINFVLNAMGHKIKYLLDVSIIYHTDRQDKIMWQLITGGIREIDIIVRDVPLSKDLFGDYENDENYRTYFQNWLNDFWKDKDQLIAKYM